MNYHVLTLFPEMIENGMNTSITGRAINSGVLHLNTVNIRDYAPPARKRRVDDYPYGGGAGMVMEAEPVYAAWRSVAGHVTGSTRTVFLTPVGKVFNQDMAREMALTDNLIFLCGHYEGIDERVIDEIVTDRVCIGDYVLTGGELAALTVTDAVVRLLPGALGDKMSAVDESFTDGLLEYEQYTRPADYNGMRVPDILLSGDHGAIARWRRQNALERTARMRPDLLADRVFEPAEQALLDSWRAVGEGVTMEEGGERDG